MPKTSCDLTVMHTQIYRPNLDDTTAIDMGWTHFKNIFTGSPVINNLHQSPLYIGKTALHDQCSSCSNPINLGWKRIADCWSILCSQPVVSILEFQHLWWHLWEWMGPQTDKQQGSSVPLNTAKFLENTHRRHPSTHLLGWYFGCVSWGYHLVYLQRLSISCFAQYGNIEEHVITGPTACNINLLGILFQFYSTSYYDITPIVCTCHAYYIL